MFSSSFLEKSKNDQPFFYLKYSDRMAMTFNGFFSSSNYELYEAQFLRNFELVLKKHKKYLMPTLNFRYLSECYFSKQKRYIWFIFISLNNFKTFSLELSKSENATKFIYSWQFYRNLRSMSAKCILNSYFF